jgi:SNF2 family N-terminal domain.
MSFLPSKNHQAKRFKSLMKVRPKVKRMIGMTGTPSSNGLMDLWAEFKLLDMGARLGRFITAFRSNYFMPDKRNRPDHFQLQATSRSGAMHLPENLRHYDFHEVDGLPDDA